MSKSVKATLHLLAAALLFAAANAQADLLDAILERGTLRVGVSLFTPWTMKDAEGKLSGFEIEVAEKLAKDMGVKPEFKVYIWEEIIPAVKKGEIDLIAGGMAITPERALKINFSRPYADSGISLATHTEKTRHIQRFEELNQESITIAVVSKSAANELALHQFDQGTVRVFDNAEQAEQAILNGEVHAWLASMPQPEFLAQRHPETVDLPLAKPVLPYKAGFGIKKGKQEWLNFLNAWVTARSADKWLSATHKYWFRSLKWQQGAKQ